MNKTIKSIIYLKLIIIAVAATLLSCDDNTKTHQHKTKIKVSQIRGDKRGFTTFGKKFNGETLHFKSESISYSPGDTLIVDRNRGTAYPISDTTNKIKIYE